MLDPRGVATGGIPSNQNAAIRTDHAPSNCVLQIGRWRVDVAARTATDGTLVRRLSPRATDLLAVLADARGEVVTRSGLMNAIWPNVTVGDESLTQAVAELRRALGDRVGSTRIIETIPKSGYRLVAPVLREAGGERAPVEGEPDAFDLEAYLMCVEAHQTMVRGGRNEIERSEALRHEAVQRAPRFALPHAHYAIVLTYAALHRGRGQGALGLALEHAETAVALRPDLAYAHAAKGYALAVMGADDAARRAFSRSLQLDDRDPEAHHLFARALLAAGNPRAAAILAERAAVLNPHDTRAPYVAARALASADPSRSKRALRACLARVEARLATDPTEPRALTLRSTILALMGEGEAARAAIEAEKDEGSAMQFYLAVAHTALGERDRALDALECLIDCGYRNGRWLLTEPMMNELRAEPRFGKFERILMAA